MTDDQLRAFIPDLVRWEGETTWMYRDVLGYVTVGIGELVHDAVHAASFPFEVDGRRATEKEIGDEFLRVIAMPKGLPADRYRSDETRVELPASVVSDLALARLRDEFLPGLVRLLPAFETFPGPAQSALVDLAWNLGLRGLEKFGHLLGAVDRRDWAAAADECHRRGVRDERNAWCRGRFLAAV